MNIDLATGYWLVYKSYCDKHCILWMHRKDNMKRLAICNYFNSSVDFNEDLCVLLQKYNVLKSKCNICATDILDLAYKLKIGISVESILQKQFELNDGIIEYVSNDGIINGT